MNQWFPEEDELLQLMYDHRSRYSHIAAVIKVRTAHPSPAPSAAAPGAKTQPPSTTALPHQAYLEGMRHSSVNHNSKEAPGG
jgi:hypothetical protein